MLVSFLFNPSTHSFIAVVVCNWQELRHYLLSLGPISPSGFGLASRDCPWRCGWRRLRGGGGGAVLGGFFFFPPPLKLNFSPFQPGPWTRDIVRARVRLPTLGLLKSPARARREILGRNQNHLFCQTTCIFGVMAISGLRLAAQTVRHRRMHELSLNRSWNETFCVLLNDVWK